MHRITGVFADPSLEWAFAAFVFRLAFPVHAFLMGLSVAASTWLALAAKVDLRISLGMIALCMSLGMAGRVRLHSMRDSARSQQIGSWIWVGSVTWMGLWLTVSWRMTALDSLCESVQKDRFASLLSLATALINGTHRRMAWLGFLRVRDRVSWPYPSPALALALTLARTLTLTRHTRHGLRSKVLPDSPLADRLPSPDRRLRRGCIRCGAR